MFRTYQALLNRLLQLCDFAAVIVSFLLAWFIKFSSGWLSFSHHLPFKTYFAIVFAYAPIFVVLNWLTGLYKPMRIRTYLSEVVSIIRSSTLSILIFMSGLYFLKLSEFSRDVLVIFSIVYIFILIFERTLVRLTLRLMRVRGFNQKYILLVGWTPTMKRFIEGLENYPWFGYKMVGYLSSDDGELKDRFGVPCLGTIINLSAILKDKVVDHVIVALRGEQIAELSAILAACEGVGVQSLIVPDYFDLLPSRPRFETFGDMPLVDTRYVPLDDAVNAAMKRLFDIVFSLVILVVLSPLFAVLATLVKLSSPGPAFYVQERVGKNRRIFPMYKFRSMYQNPQTPDDGGWTIPNDPRKTKIGSFLRKTSLDELPQFWNVLLGHMSVIGPRPERPNYVEKFGTEIPRYMLKHRVRPGITGWAQVNGWRGNTSIIERIRCDIEYIEGWSFWLDIKIIFKTLKDGLVNSNAY